MEAEVQEAPVCPPPVPKPKATIITTTVESTPAATESQTQAGASPNGGAQPKREPSTDRKTIGVKDRKTRFSPMTGFFSNRMTMQKQRESAEEEDDPEAAEGMHTARSK